MEVVLRSLLVLVIVFSIALLADTYLLDAEIVQSVYREAFSIVFAVAPTSLFFISNYAVCDGHHAHV